jgi:hypothetical protein
VRPQPISPIQLRYERFPSVGTFPSSRPRSTQRARPAPRSFISPAFPPIVTFTSLSLLRISHIHISSSPTKARTVLPPPSSRSTTQQGQEGIVFLSPLRLPSERWLRSPAGSRRRGRRANILSLHPCSPDSSARARPTRRGKIWRRATTTPQLPLRSSSRTEVSLQWILGSCLWGWVLVRSFLAGSWACSYFPCLRLDSSWPDFWKQVLSCLIAQDSGSEFISVASYFTRLMKKFNLCPHTVPQIYVLVSMRHARILAL